MHLHIARNESKIRHEIETLQDEERSKQMMGILDEILKKYPELPQNLKERTESKPKPRIDKEKEHLLSN